MGQPIAHVEERQAQGARRAHASAVSAMFGTIASRYDLLNRLLSLGIDRGWRRRAVTLLAESLESDSPESESFEDGVKASGPLLDVCAGTMDLSCMLVHTFETRPVVAADFSEAMLQKGRAKVPDQVMPVVADALQLPCPSGIFAGATVAFGIRNVADVGAMLSEVRRVLAARGVLVVLEFFRPASFATRIFHWLYGRAILPLVGGLVSGHIRPYRYLSESMRGFYYRDEFEELAARSGFVVESAEDLFLGVASVVVLRCA